MRFPWPAAAAGGAAVVLGAAGLIRGAVPQSSGGGAAAAGHGNPIVVSGAYVRPPAAPSRDASAYFTVYNETDRADRLVSVTSGAGQDTVLHTSGMATDPNGALVPAHGKLVLSPGHGHVMIEKVFGPLLRGQTVNIDLTFATNGVVPVTATVIPYGQPAPGGSR